MLDTETDSLLSQLPDIKQQFEKAHNLTSASEYLDNVIYHLSICNKLQKVNNFSILIKKLPLLLKQHSKETSLLFIQTVVRSDILGLINETSEILVNKMSISEEIEYILSLLDLVKLLNNFDEHRIEKYRAKVFFRLTDQLKEYIQKNENNQITKLSVQKKRSKSLGLSLEINSLVVHNFDKLTSLQAFNFIHNFDLIHISEFFLDSTFTGEELSWNFSSNKLTRLDHLNDIKRGGVSVFYRDTLPISFLNIKNLPECIIGEINQSKCFFVSLYRSPSQTTNELE